MLFRHPDKRSWHFVKLSQPAPGRHFAGCLLPIREFVDAVLDPGCRAERVLGKDKSFTMSKGDQLTIPASVGSIQVGLGWTAKDGLDLDASCLFLKDIDSDGDLDPVHGVYYRNKLAPGVFSRYRYRKHVFIYSVAVTYVLFYRTL